MPLRRADGLSALESLRRHWPEYVMEAGELGLYMFVTCAVAVLIHHPASPVRQFVSDPVSRRALMGVALGATLTAIVLSPWGKQSGGHFNPAVTLAFYRLGKVEFWDAWFYAGAQFLGAILGVCIARFALRGTLSNYAVHFAMTTPGVYGPAIAFVAEIAISFVLMTVVLFTTNRARFTAYTPFVVGVLVAIYITFETPLSGMSTNPARTFGPALHKPATGTCCGFTFSPPHWGCCWPPRFFCGQTAVSLRTVESCTTPTISAASSITNEAIIRRFR